MTDPVNSDAALVREALAHYSAGLAGPVSRLEDALAAVARLAAAAERADEHRALMGKLDAALARATAAEAALLVAQQERTALERERDILFKGDWAMLNQQLERAEATITRLRGEIENALDYLNGILVEGSPVWLVVKNLHAALKKQ